MACTFSKIFPVDLGSVKSPFEGHILLAGAGGPLESELPPLAAPRQLTDADALPHPLSLRETPTFCCDDRTVTLVGMQTHG